MFRLMWKIMRIKVTVLLAVGVGLLMTGWLRLRKEHRSWAVMDEDVARALPGDDLVPAPGIVETRSLLVGAPPSAVWPWLVQMGYGRGGWYSYDALDMKGKSAGSILPEYQDLAAGDVVPTHPGGGFVARVVEPEKALVLYLDTQLVKDQAASSGEGAAAGVSRERPAERLIPGLAMAGAMGEVTMPEFRATWAFVLEPESGERTRLIERFRVWTVDAGLPQRLGMPLMGYGVFAMTRKHMLGVKERSERRGTSGSSTGRAGAAERAGAPAQAEAPEQAGAVEPAGEAVPVDA